MIEVNRTGVIINTELNSLSSSGKLSGTNSIALCNQPGWIPTLSLIDLPASPENAESTAENRWILPAIILSEFLSILSELHMRASSVAKKIVSRTGIRTDTAKCLTMRKTDMQARKYCFLGFRELNWRKVNPLKNENRETSARSNVGQ